MRENLVRVFLSGIALLLIVLHILQPDWQIDTVTLGLLIVGVIPWLYSFIESAELPGGWKVKFRELKVVVEEQKRKIENQQEKIENQQEKLANQKEIINQLVVYSMSASIYTHLREIYKRKQTGQEYIYRNNEAFRREMYYLRDNGYIEYARGGFVDFNQEMEGKNLVDAIKLTPVGNFYVELREQYENVPAKPA